MAWHICYLVPSAMKSVVPCASTSQNLVEAKCTKVQDTAQQADELTLVPTITRTSFFSVSPTQQCKIFKCPLDIFRKARKASFKYFPSKSINFEVNSMRMGVCVFCVCPRRTHTFYLCEGFPPHTNNKLGNNNA